jgi:hypothetical protein
MSLADNLRSLENRARRAAGRMTGLSHRKWQSALPRDDLGESTRLASRTHEEHGMPCRAVFYYRSRKRLQSTAPEVPSTYETSLSTVAALCRRRPRPERGIPPTCARASRWNARGGLVFPHRTGLLPTPLRPATSRP